MTKFNPENKKSLTYGECLHPAMKITDEADAQQYLADYIAYIEISPRKDGMTGEQIALNNLGYFAGYYDNETRERVERLFECSHPIFGSIAKKGPPTVEEAFEAGKRMASAQRLTAGGRSARADCGHGESSSGNRPARDPGGPRKSNAHVR